MIRSLIIASAIVLGTVSAQAAGIESAANQANVLEGLQAKPAATMTFEGRASTVGYSTDVPRNESILGK